MFFLCLIRHHWSHPNAGSASTKQIQVPAAVVVELSALLLLLLLFCQPVTQSHIANECQSVGDLFHFSLSIFRTTIIIYTHDECTSDSHWFTNTLNGLDSRGFHDLRIHLFRMQWAIDIQFISISFRIRKRLTLAFFCYTAIDQHYHFDRLFDVWIGKSVHIRFN